MTTPNGHRGRTDAAGAGTIALGGELTVHRLGFGAMRLPEDRRQAHVLLRRRLVCGDHQPDHCGDLHPGRLGRPLPEASGNCGRDRARGGGGVTTEPA
jgi:hypothetical protein